MNELIQMFVDYLYVQVKNHDIYTLGAQGQLVVDILPKIPELENVERTKQILNKIKQNFYEYKSFDVFTARAFDCSGLGTEFFMKNGLIKNDTTADGLYKLCDRINFKELQLGDMVFQESTRVVKTWDDKLSKNVEVRETYQHHVGYVARIDNGTIYIVEAKGRSYGVVESVFSKSNWDNAGRPRFWNSTPQPVPPTPVKPVLKRELSLKDPMMRGDDVSNAQWLLNNKGYNPGTIDGIFGKNTDIATKNFQTDNNLTADGIIGKKTATALGFDWEG